MLLIAWAETIVMAGPRFQQYCCSCQAFVALNRTLHTVSLRNGIKEVSYGPNGVTRLPHRLVGGVERVGRNYRA